MKIKRLFIWLILIQGSLYSCSNINLESLEYIDKSGLYSCSSLQSSDIDSIDVELDSIKITFQKLLKVMTNENDNIGKQILAFNKKIKSLKKRIIDSKNLYNQKNSVIKKSKEINAQLKDLRVQIEKSSINLVEAQKKMVDVLCVIKKRYKFYEQKLTDTRISNTKNLHQGSLGNLSDHCDGMQMILGYIDNFLKSFKALEKSIDENENHTFAMASSVITFVSNDKVCNRQSCIYNEIITLDTLFDLMDSYEKNSKILVEINKKYK